MKLCSLLDISLDHSPVKDWSPLHESPSIKMFARSSGG
jgi:hypothetical protein